MARQADRDRDYRREAEQLALLPLQTQRDYIAMYRAKAANAKLSKSDRDDARQRAAALERLLGLAKQSR